MNEELVVSEVGHVEWRAEFHRYYDAHGIEEFLSNVIEEITNIGWPSKKQEFVNFQEHKEDLSYAANIRMRLTSIRNKVNDYKDDLKDRYDNTLFFLKSAPETKGKIKEDKKKYAELELNKEKNILNKIDKVLRRISDLSEAYKIKYEVTSRTLSIVEYEWKQTGRES